MSIFSANEVVSIPNTSTPNLTGYRIERTIGVVSIVVAPAAGVVSDWLAMWSDFFGSRSQAYEDKFNAPLAIALNSLKKKVVEMGGNGLVGIHHVAVAPPGDKSVILYSVMGTAVVCRNKRTGKLPHIEEVYMPGKDVVSVGLLEPVKTSCRESSSREILMEGPHKSGPDIIEEEMESGNQNSSLQTDYSRMGPSSKSKG